MISGTYNLLSTDISQNPIQELWLECDTTLAPVTINLFEIAELQRQWSIKIHISDASNNASANAITINASPLNYFDDDSTPQISINVNGSAVILQVSSETQWFAIESVGGGGGTLPSNKGQLVNITNGQTISSIISRVFTFGETTINPSIDFTGSTAETLLTSVLIPANTYKVGDLITNPFVRIQFSYLQLIASLTMKSYYNTINSLSGATLTNTLNFSGIGINDTSFFANLINTNSKEGEFISNSKIQVVDFAFCPVQYVDVPTFDITQDNYILFTVTLKSAPDKISVARLISEARVLQNI